MQNNKLILILAFMAVFLLTNGTFFVLCEKDIVLDYINKFGNWSSACLYHSAIIFGVYKLTDYAYNLDYVLPKIINSLAPVKWVDRLNGYLGFNSQGELEQYLASHRYHPLYKDAISGFYSHIGYPFYNYWYAPLVGVKPLKGTESLNVPEPVVFEYIREKKTTITNTKYHFIDKHDEDILRLENSLNNLTEAIRQETLAHLNKKTKNELLEELRLIKTLEDIPTYTLDKLKESFIEYNFSHIRFNDNTDSIPMRIEYIQFFKDSRGVKIKFDSSSFLTDFVVISTSSFSQMFPVLFAVGNHKVNSPTTQMNIFYCPKYDETVHLGLFSRYTYNPEASVFREMDDQFQFFKNTLMQYGYEMPGVIKLNALETMENYQLTNAELINSQILDLQQDIRSRYIESMPNNPQDNLEEMYEGENRQAPTLPAEESSTLIEENLLPAISVGALTTLTVGQALVVFSYFLGIETFQAMIYSNIHVQEALIALYNSNNMEMPTILSDAINNSPVHPSNSFTFDANSPTSGLPSGADNSIVKYVGYSIIALGAVGIAWYLTKHGMDATPAVETAKSLKDTLHDRYVNFK